MRLSSQRHRGRLSAAVLLAALLLVIAGCGGGNNGASPAQNSRSTSLSLSLTWPNINAKSGVAGRAFPVAANSLTVTVTDASGFTDTRTLVRPPAGSPTTVTATFTRLAAGQAAVAASAFASESATGPVLSQATNSVVLQNNRQASATLVFPSPIVVIALNPANLPLVRGGTAQLTATAADDRNQVFTPAGTWASSNPAVATVDANGNVSGVGVGTSVITFTDSVFGKTGQATATISSPAQITQITLSPANQTIAPGAMLALSATGSDANGGVYSNPPGVWVSSDAAVAAVDASGVVTAIKPGVVQITFTDSVYGVSGSTNVRVRGGDAEVIVQ